MISRSGPFSVDRFRTMLDRMVKSARLDSNTFLSLKEDSTATGQALIVLALVGVSFGVGFGASVGGDALVLIQGALLGAILSIVLGFVWLSLTFLIGTRLFGGTSGYWSLSRPIFFSSSPGLVFLVMSIPVTPIPDIARAIGLAWMAISSVFAVKTALGLDSQRSLLIFIIVTIIIFIAFGLVVSLAPV
jgi:Yip1 domain